MLLCSDLVQMDSSAAAVRVLRHRRHRNSVTRIRKRRCCCGQLKAEQPQPQPTTTTTTTIPGLSLLGPTAAAALTAAAMLHTTNALSATVADAIALPLQTATATPAAHEWNATLLSSTTAASTTSSMLNESSINLVDAAADEDWFDHVVLVFKACVMLLIIIAAICGNLLVIISVMRVRKLSCSCFLDHRQGEAKSEQRTVGPLTGNFN